MNKISNFSPKPWTNPFGKMPILWVFELTFSSSRKASLLYELRKIVFYNLTSRSITKEYRGLEEIRMGDRGLKEVTGGYKG